MDETILRALLAQQSVPDASPTFGRVVTIPALLGLAGLIIFGILYRLSLNKKASLPLRHLGTALILAGLVVSFRTFLLLTDKDTGAIYSASIISEYTRYAHYAAPAVLLLLLVGIGAAELYLNKSMPSRPK